MINSNLEWRPAVQKNEEKGKWYLSVHAVPSSDWVFNCICESVAQVKFAGDVGRRDYHHEHILLFVLDRLCPVLQRTWKLSRAAHCNNCGTDNFMYPGCTSAIFWFEESRFFPPREPGSLDIFWTVSIWQGSQDILFLPWSCAALIVHNLWRKMTVDRATSTYYINTC